MIIDPSYGSILSVFLFSIGLLIIIVKRNAIFVLIGIELILNAANLNFVVFSVGDPTNKGQLFGVFGVVLAAAEAAIALAVLLNIYKYYKTTDLHKLNRLKY